MKTIILLVITMSLFVSSVAFAQSSTATKQIPNSILKIKTSAEIKATNIQVIGASGCSTQLTATSLNLSNSPQVIGRCIPSTSALDSSGSISWNVSLILQDRKVTQKQCKVSLFVTCKTQQQHSDNVLNFERSPLSREDQPLTSSKKTTLNCNFQPGRTQKVLVGSNEPRFCQRLFITGDSSPDNDVIVTIRRDNQ